MKRIIKLFKKKHFYFLIIVYPLLAYCAGFSERVFYDFFNTGPYYGYIVSLIAAVIVLFTVLEIIKRVQGYELQGDKLKMRQREGLHVEKVERH